MDIGYIRVSTFDQNTARQNTAFEKVRLDKVFEDKASGKDVHRPELERCLEMLREGDVLHVHSIDRLARSSFASFGSHRARGDCDFPQRKLNVHPG